MIHTPAASALILDAMKSVLLANNGYADIGMNAEVAAAMETAGFVVIRTTNLHGNPVNRAFTKAAQESLRTSPHGISTYKDFTTRQDAPDYEGAILARNDRHLFA